MCTGTSGEREGDQRIEHMNRKYRLIALDMDGTVLNEKKKIDEETRNAIHRALANGIEVVFCTGRSLSEMKEILKEFPDMHYLCGESGAFVYELQTEKVLHRDAISPEVVKILRAVSESRTIMPCVFSEGICYANAEDIPQMDKYQMGEYQSAYERVCTPVKDVMRMMTEQQRSAEKINLFHTSVQERSITRAYLEKQNLDAELVDSEISSLECSPRGVSKASGLRYLCEKLGIGMEEIVMVGDADNDIEALKAAGLAVAMGNANERVKKISDLIVADNNHHGCAEAIAYVTQQC